MNARETFSSRACDPTYTLYSPGRTRHSGLNLGILVCGLLLLIAPPLQADRQRGHLLADRRRGHIFVMNTDLRFLACDAWLCPVSESIELSPRWQRSIRECEQPERPRGWGSSIRAVRCLPRTAAALRRRREERYKQYEHPRPYLTLVMGEPLPASLLSLNQFLDQVVADLRGRSRFGRALFRPGFQCAASFPKYVVLP